MSRKDQESLGKSARTRARILEVALDLFAARGYAGTSMGDIAAAAGVVRQTVVNHFPRKEDLVLAWGERRRDALAEVEVADGDLAGRLHAVYDRLADMNESERAMTRELLHVFWSVDRSMTVPDVVTGLLADAAARGELRTHVDVAAAGEVLTGVYADTLRRWLEDDEPGTLAERLRTRVAMVVGGLTT